MTAPNSRERILPRLIEEEMQQSFINYSMSVIVSRALPDVRDGLKPVHRRILYAMNELGLVPGRAFKKSATVVGDVLGKYHPHGDSSVYDAMVRMVQDFSLRYPLVDGQGNFGSVDGDPAAAYRYTEARLTRVAMAMLEDIDKNTVNFQPNFDDRLQEPTVLPGKIPNLLVNGSSGIAVGMATNIPPHNIREVARAIEMLVDNPDATAAELRKAIPGPDFPTGGYIYGREGIREAYETGRGKVVMRARAVIEEKESSGKARIVVTEIPYQVNKEKLIIAIAEMVAEKKLDGISGINDESDKDGMRIVIDLKRDAIPNVVLNQLYKHSAMQSTFGVIMLALDHGAPKVMPLRDILTRFIEHRHEVITRRTQFDLDAAQAREHILEGLKIAVDNIDEVIRIIRGSEDTAEADRKLRERFALSEKQTDAILNMRLAKLTGLEIEKLEAELKDVRATIKDLKAILASREKRMGILKEEMREVAKDFGDERRTEILADLKENDWVEHLFIASTHDYLMFFTNEGQVYWLKVHEVPQAGRAARGKPVVNCIAIKPTEHIRALVPVREFSEDRHLIFATRQGTVKKTVLSEYGNVRSTGIRAINIEQGDELIDVQVCDSSSDIVLASAGGMSIRFHQGDVRDMGRATTGVKGIELDADDNVIGMVVVRRDCTLLVVSEKGYGKRSELSEYRVQKRGGKGIITFKVTGKTGSIVALKEVIPEDELMMITRHGVIIRVPVDGIRVIGRNTQGVRVMNLDEGDSVVGVARVVNEESSGEEAGEAEVPGAPAPSGEDG
jgi:DNA gyrase subunit A